VSGDLERVQAIANGGGFDQVQAVRLLAKVFVEQVANKQAPSATMDAPDQPETQEVAPKRKKAAPEATA
jgi:hypothetical protein